MLKDILTDEDKTNKEILELKPLVADMWDVVNTDYPPDDFVLPGLPRGNLGLLSATGGTGKSFWVLQAMLQVTIAGLCNFNLAGAKFKPGDNRIGSVLYVSLEDKLPQIRKRMQAVRGFWAHGKDKTSWINESLQSGLFKILPLSGKNIRLFDNPAYFDQILDVANSMHHCRLIVIDTLRRSHSENENDNGAMSCILMAFEKLAEDSNTAVLLLHHESKGAANDKNAGQGAMRGASALADNARWIMRMQKMTPADAEDRGIGEDERKSWVRVTCEKTSYDAEMPTAWLKRGVGGVLIADEPPSGKKIKGGSNGGGKKRRRSDDI
jgi:RecA-family ATPase